MKKHLYYVSILLVSMNCVAQDSNIQITNEQLINNRNQDFQKYLKSIYKNSLASDNEFVPEINNITIVFPSQPIQPVPLLFPKFGSFQMPCCKKNKPDEYKWLTQPVRYSK